MNRKNWNRLILTIIPIIITVAILFGTDQNSRLDSYESRVIIDATFLLNIENNLIYNYNSANHILQLLSLELIFTKLNESEKYNLYLQKTQDAKTLTDEASDFIKEETNLLKDFNKKVNRMNNQSIVVYYTDMAVWMIAGGGATIFIYTAYESIENQKNVKTKSKRKKLKLKRGK